jgi:ketosteroid isomerase-like protein
MKTRHPLSLCIALISIVVLFPAQRGLAASASPAAQAVLRQEARWIAAIVNGDRATVAAILRADFKHIDDRGTLIDLAQELASTTKLPIAMNLTQETVDFDSSGDAAVVHGLNTITQPGKPASRARFTDVFVKQNGTWLALSAQETAIAP